MRRRFFVDRFNTKSATLRGDSAEHLGRVLRAEPGQLYELSDGNTVWLARVEYVTLPRRAEKLVEFSLVENIPAREPTLHIQLLLALIKFERFEWCIEKATELGVNEIVTLAAARTDRPLMHAAGKRQARWKKIVLEASQQSRRLRPPVFAGATPTTPSEKAFERCAAPVKIILSERREAKPINEILRGAKASALALAIGPEGGWTEDEIVAASSAGFLEASLGENILRTETAVVAALAVLRFALAE
jgi:16S rRNA (uracil1498-N3)-methyltransferase